MDNLERKTKLNSAHTSSFGFDYYNTDTLPVGPVPLTVEQTLIITKSPRSDTSFDLSLITSEHIPLNIDTDKVPHWEPVEGEVQSAQLESRPELVNYYMEGESEPCGRSKEIIDYWTSN